VASIPDGRLEQKAMSSAPREDREQVSSWQRLVAAYDDELWSRGLVDGARHDLMSITGNARDELSHSRAVEWLLDPRGSHGLGSRVLQRVLEAGWGVGAADGCDRARVRREQEKGITRADVVVDIDTSTLVIENKVDAREQSDQCDDLVNRWGTETRYLFRSPHGGRPLSARSRTATAAWRWTSYGELGRLLLEELAMANGPGRAALEDYLTTIDRQFGLRPKFEIHQEGKMRVSDEPVQDGDPPEERPDPFDTPELRFFIAHRPEIRSIGELEKRFESTLAAEVRELLPVIRRSLLATHGPVDAANLHWARVPAHPMVWSPRWMSPTKEPLVAIGLGWDGTDVAGKCLYTGVFVRNVAEAEDRRKRLTAILPKPPQEGWEPGLYPIVYRYVDPLQGWWERLPEWRASLVAAVDVTWKRFAPSIDSAFVAPGD
jgi:hypothetical protein